MPTPRLGRSGLSARRTAPSRSSTQPGRRGSRSSRPARAAADVPVGAVLRAEEGRRSPARAAIERYLASETKGRFIQSLKAYLADRTFEGTGIGTQHYTLEKLIALIGKHMSDRLGLRVVAGAAADRPRPAGAFLESAATPSSTPSPPSGC